MAQNTGAISSAEFKVEGGTNGSSWTDYSGTTLKITPSGGDRASGEVNTFDGDTPIVTWGKRASVDITVEYVYSEGASDLFEALRAAYEAGTAWYWRWAPKGGQSGEFQFATAAGRITAFEYPKGDAGSGAPVVLTAVQKSASFTKSVVA